MKKVIFIMLLLVIPLSAQQIDFTYGTDLYGNALSATSFGYLDSTGATAEVMYIDMDNFYWVAGDTVIGTLWYYLDAKNATDSVDVYLRATPMYNTVANDVLVNAKAGSAVTIKTVTNVVSDQSGGVNVYLDGTNDPDFPPRWIKLSATAFTNCYDSVTVYMQFSRPTIHEVFSERKEN